MKVSRHTRDERGESLRNQLLSSESVSCMPLPCLFCREGQVRRQMEGGSLVAFQGGERGEEVAKARDFIRKPEIEGRWNKEDSDKLRGTPWEPYPGA